MLAAKLLSVSRSPSESITYINNYTVDSTSSASVTFSGVDFGIAYAGRRIVVIVGSIVLGTTAGNISSVSIGGVSATQASYIDQRVSNSLAIGIFVATVTTGTSGNVVITTNAGGTGGSRVLQVFSLDSIKTSIVQGTDSSSPFEFTRTFGSNEIYIGGGRCLSTATETWTNATEAAATTISGSQRISSATYFPSASGSRTITFTPSSTTGALMVNAVFT